MATRINTRFVLLLAIAVSTAFGIVGGLWVLQIRGDTSRHIEAGDALMAEARALDALGNLLRPCDPDRLQTRLVTTHVNSPRNDDPTCIQARD